MENPPLHGFRFRPQSPLKISNQTEADDIKADDEEWQGSPEYELRPPRYHKSNEILIAKHDMDRCHHAQRFNSAFPRVIGKCHQDLRQSDPTDPNFSDNYPPLTVKNKAEIDDADPLWYQSCLPAAQPLKIEDFDELIWQIPVPETPVNRYLSHESTIEPDEQEYSERGSDSGASTMTLIYVPEVEDDVYEMTIGSIDEDSFEGNESFEDVTSEGEAMVDRYRVESEDDDEDEDEETGDDDDEDDSEEQGEGEGEGDSELEQAGESEEAEFVMQPYGYGLDTLEGLFHDDFDYFYEI